MKLEDLLGSLEKAASEHQKPEASDDKPQVSKQLDALLTKEAAAENASRALEMGEEAAKSILEKLATQALEEATASEKPAVEDVKAEAKEEGGEEKQATAETKPETTEEDMDKQAKEAGKELAQAIIEKLAAQENSEPTGPGKVRADTSKMKAFDDRKISGTPGRNGTINQVFDALVAKAKKVSNPVAYDQVAANGSEASQSAAEAKDKAMGTPAIPPSPDIREKQAAVDALCEAGLDWETAVELVKSAAQEIETEEFEQVKSAAVNQLVSEGYDFEDAVEMVKEASEDEYEYVEDPEGEYSAEASDAEGEEVEITEQEKTAAVDELVGEGYSFEDAVDLVKEAASMGKLKKAFGKAKDRVGDVAHKGRLALRRFGRKAGAKADEAKAAAGKRYRKVKKHVGKHPGKYGAGAGAAAGAAAGAGATYAAMKKD